MYPLLDCDTCIYLRASSVIAAMSMKTTSERFLCAHRSHTATAFMLICSALDHRSNDKCIRYHDALDAHRLRAKAPSAVSIRPRVSQSSIRESGGRLCGTGKNAA